MSKEKYLAQATKEGKDTYGYVPSPSPVFNNLETKGFVPSPAPTTQSTTTPVATTKK